MLCTAERPTDSQTLAEQLLYEQQFPTPPGEPLYISTRSAPSGTRKPAAPPVHADDQTQDHGQKSTSTNRWPLFGGCVVGSLSA